MAVVDWIDVLQSKWAAITFRGKNVKAPLVYKRAEWPEAIGPNDFPLALSRVTSVRTEYSSGLSLAYWTGVTEFHITPSNAKELIPDIMLFYAEIYAKAANNITLDGKVQNFVIGPPGGGTSIEGPLEFQYGKEPPHFGLRVNWFVKEDISSEITVAA